MAITRTQIARQLYQAGGGADFGAPDKAKERAEKGYGNPSGGKAASKNFNQDAKPGEQSPEVYGVTGKQYDPDAALAAAVKAALKKPKGILNKIPSAINLTRSIINSIPFFKRQSEKNRIDYFKFLGPEYYDEEEGLKNLPANLQALYDEGKLSSQQATDVLMKMNTGEYDFPEYMATIKGSPGLKYKGNVGNLEKFVSSYEKNPDGSFKLSPKGYKIAKTYGYKEKLGDGSGGDGGMSDYERRLLELEQALKAQTAAATSTVFQPNFRVLADGGMTEDAPVEGGIMDLESGRQMYFLGKLVKKATRAIKKIVKSPIGKIGLGAALLGASGGIGGLGNFLKTKALNFGLYKAGEGLTGKGMLALGGGLTLAPFLFGNEEEEQQPMYQGADLPYPIDYYLSGNFPINRRLVADGGIMRTNYQEGGDAEPVAKKTMPLIDMDGKEKDYRETGGFVDMGRMERADDVPARLSKNEFVFTADAVRNAGEGDIDKGAEVMYNMMKNLESGGEVSEESQGLEGAREMFQTSQRLEEVL